MSLEMRNCLDCNGLFHRRSGHIRCALCSMVHSQEHYRSTVSKPRSEDRGIYDTDLEVKAAAEKLRAAELWFCRMRGAKWNVQRRDDQG